MKKKRARPDLTAGGQTRYKRRMKPAKHPTGAEIRTAMLERVQAFSELTGTSTTAIGRAVFRDSKFIPRAKDGHNFTVESYDRLMKWLDERWPK